MKRTTPMRKFETWSKDPLGLIVPYPIDYDINWVLLSMETEKADRRDAEIFNHLVARRKRGDAWIARNTAPAQRALDNPTQPN